MWFRSATVITLGELFLALGNRHTARSIYAFYLTLRIVAVKRRKVGEQIVGMTSIDFQGAKLRL